METIVSCILKDSGIIYTLNRDKRGISLTHPSLYPYLYEYKKEQPATEEEKYYAQKADYLKNNGYMDSVDSTFEGVLTEGRVSDLLSNIHQVVFEVTDACNLKCKYCGYGEYYSDYDVRQKRKMNPEVARQLISYLKEAWDSNQNKSVNPTTFFSFYGGEPLLNVPFIEEVINYIESLAIEKRKISYSMTTNAMLLDKYMDFLVRHSFNVLISLDGDEYGHSYRVTASGNNSFRQVISNIELLREKYPDYFKEYVNFNAVIQNRNSVKSAFDFIYNNFGKIPTISELNQTGIRADKKEEFNNLYQNVEESLYQSDNSEELEKKLFMHTPAYHTAANFLHQYNHGIVKSYNDFFSKPTTISYIPTGTCMPFSKKIFITVNGKILPCERIGQQYALGEVTESGVDLSTEVVTKRYNDYLNKFKQCAHCYRSGICTQCMFNLDELNDTDFHCPAFMSKQDFIEFFGRNMLFLESHREDYKKLMQIYLE